MKIVKRLICAALAAATMLAGAPAFAADSAAAASYWRDVPVVEGNHAYCWNEAGKQTYYLVYNGEVCAPLRTVAEWMGKDLTKDANGKSFALTGSKTPLFRDQAYAEKGEERIYSSLSSAEYLAKMEESVPVTALSDAKLTLDGKAVAIVAANNKPASLISWAGDVYVPLHTAAAMMQMTMNQTQRVPVLNGVECPVIENVYIHTPLADEQKAACQTYAIALKKVFDAYREKGSYNVSTMEQADAAIKELLGYMNTLKNTPKPDARLLDKEYAEIQSAVEENIKVYQNIQKMIQNGEDLKKIQFAIQVDWELRGYPNAQFDMDQRGAEALAADAMYHVLRLYNIVFEL